MIYHRVVTTVTRRTPDVEQELFSLLQQFSPEFYYWIFSYQSRYVLTIIRPFSFCHFIVCSSIYDFWLPPLASSNIAIIIKTKVIFTQAYVISADFGNPSYFGLLPYCSQRQLFGFQSNLLSLCIPDEGYSIFHRP